MHNSLLVRFLASTIILAASLGSVAQDLETKPELQKRDKGQFEDFAEPENESEAPSIITQEGPMTLRRLTAIIEEVGANVVAQQSSVTFTFDNAQLIAVVAEGANRMRIVAPVIAANEMTEEQMAATLVSNYHLALDARYAVGDGVLYSVFIHPLRELTGEQVLSAIRQVATLRNTFGTSYSSGEMSFGVPSEEQRIDI